MPQDVGADAGPQSVVLADVNDDGLDDLIAINRLNDSTKVLIRLAQEEGGTFADPPTEVNLFVDDDNQIPVALAVDDVGSSFVSPQEGRSDGNLDIVVATEDGLVVIVVGDGEGGFQVRDEVLDVATEPIGVALGDFDDDSDVDIAVLDGGDTAVIVLNDGAAFNPDDTAEFELDNDSDAVDIAAADFDGDETLDLATLNHDQATISLLIGDGDGGFDDGNVVKRSTSSDIDDDELPADFAIADLDGDEVADAVVMNDGDFGSTQLLVRASPSLQGDAALTGPFSGSGVALADFNDDGPLDVAMLSSGDEGTSFLPGTGTSSGFVDTSPERIGPSGRAIAAGEFSGDDRPDFVVLNNAGNSFSVAINLGNNVTPSPGTPTTPPTSAVTGTPTPTRPTNTPTPTATATRIPTVPLSTCSVQLRQASGQGASNALQRPSALASGDIDGNATQDVVVADREQGKVFALLLDPSRFDRRSDGCVIPIDPSPSALPGVTPTPAAFYTELDGISQPLDVALGQLSRPEQLTTDLAVVGSAGLSLFFGNGTGGFGNRLNFTNLGSDARSVVITDIDLDGIRDVVVALHDQRKLVIFKGGGNRTFTEALRLDTIDDPVALVVDRIDFDEYPDLAFVATRDRDLVGTARIYLSPGKLIGVPPPPTPTPEPTPNLTVILTGPPTDLATEDFNRDGTVDLVTTLADGPFVILTTARSGDTVTVTASTSQTTGGSPIAVGAGRFDDNPQDLEPDVVVADSRNDDALFFYKSGSTFSGQSPVKVGIRPVALSVADFDNDRRPDVLVAGETGGTLTLLRSAVAPSTPTPTHTFTVTPTPTITPTQPTGTPTRSATATESAQPSRTPTLTPRNTPKPGTFELSDNGCAVVPTDGSGSWAWFAVALGVVVLRMRGSRDPR